MMKNLSVVLLATITLTLTACSSSSTSEIKSKPVKDITTTSEITSSAGGTTKLIEAVTTKTTQTKSEYSTNKLEGTYIGDDGKTYEFTSDGSLEIDSKKFKLSKPNMSTKQSTGEEFTNYNILEVGATHSSAYVEVYKDRVEIAYAGPVKSTVLTKK